MRRHLLRIGLLPVVLAGCAAPSCQRTLSAELLFGLARPGAAITEAEFVSFLDNSVTPRFPMGLTVFDGDGRWQRPDGHLTQERSKLVLIVTAPGLDTIARLQAVRSDYKKRFDQQSVGMVLTPSCADFQ